MKPRVKSTRKVALAKSVLRRRVMRWYDRLNRQRWSDCFALVDPRLTTSGKVRAETYSHSLLSFQNRYGAIHPWHVRISLHLTSSRPSSDPRPFAYVYTVWQDERHEFHMFRERWVQDGDNWFTRVVGLVVNDAASNQAG